MTFSGFMKDVRSTFSSELSSFLSGKGLKALKVLNSGINLEKRNLSIAVFPTSASGSTMEEQSGSDIVRFTVLLYCNAEATENGLAQGEEYYSAILEFIQKRTFGEESQLDASLICRMDEGYPVNGAEFLVSSRISSNTDFGWD